MKNDIAIIGASYLQLPLIKKAKEMGYTTHVFAWAAQDVGETVADYFYPISIIEKEKILSKCREIGICGICSIASDLAIITVNYVANFLGLPGNSMEATMCSTNKHLMRMAFDKNGDPSPHSVLVDSTTDLDCLTLQYPVIVKPTDRSGSRGICKLEDHTGLATAVKHALAEGFEKKALVEEFAQGEEYSVEYISHQGVHHFLALTMKYTTGAPYFIETGHLQPAPIDEVLQEKVKRIVPHALDTLGIQNGASHTELKIASDGAIKLIEIGGRMGGDCIGSDLVPCSTGYDFVRMVIDVATGKKPDFTKICEPRRVESIFLLTQADIAELNRLRQEEPNRLISIVDYHPENLNCVTDSSNRAGCYIRQAK